MSEKKLLITGIIGTVIAALCCFTKVLVALLGVVGLGTFVGYLDYVLLPSLAFFIFLTACSVWCRQRRSRCRVIHTP